MSKLLKATADETDFTITAEFEGGNKIIWNMREKMNSIRFAGINKPGVFKNVVVDGKAIRWPDAPNAMELAVDEMVFGIRG